MKKVLCFLCALLILITSLTVYVGAALHGESENVTFRLVDEGGDSSYLSGITTHSSYNHYGLLNWDVDFAPFENEVNAGMTFRKTGYNVENEPYYGFGASMLAFSEYRYFSEKLNEAIENLKAEDAKPGDIKVLKAKMTDYFEYYPVNFVLDLPEMSVSWVSGSSFSGRGGYYSFYGLTPSRGDGLVKAINDYLKIPVRENESFEIKLHWGDNGSYSLNCNRRNFFDFEFYNAVFSDTLYFTFSNEIYFSTVGTRYLCDTSEIPGGYGIYALPYGEGEIKYDEITTVYSVPADCVVQSLSCDEEKNVLYLTVHENDRYVLHVIDRATMTDISVIDIFSFTCDDFARVYVYDDFLVFIKNDTDFCIVKRNSDGTYGFAFSGAMPAEYVADRDYFSYYSTFAFDGERFVVFTSEVPNVEEISIMSIQPDIMVFTEDGVQYYAKWTCSLGSPLSPGSYTTYFVGREPGFTVEIS